MNIIPVIESRRKGVVAPPAVTWDYHYLFNEESGTSFADETGNFTANLIQSSSYSPPIQADLTVAGTEGTGVELQRKGTAIELDASSNILTGSGLSVFVDAKCPSIASGALNQFIFDLSSSLIVLGYDNTNKCFLYLAGSKIQSAGIISTNTFYEIGFTHDKVSNVSKLYVDRVEVASLSKTLGDPSGVAATIGKALVNTSYGMVGTVDNLRIKKAVLSQQEITNMS